MNPYAHRPALDHFLRVAVEYLLDSRTGIIQTIGEHLDSEGGSGLFQFAASGRGINGATVHSGGASLDRRSALAKTIGEAVERYAGDWFDPAQARLTSYAQADFPCVHPAEMARYTPEQLAEPGFPAAVRLLDEHTKVRWVPAVELPTGTRCYVPAAMVFCPYQHQPAEGEPPVLQPITTGLASHVTLADACVSAICEVVERDAFTIVWQARMSIPSIRLESLDDDNRDLATRHTRSGGLLRLFDMTLDHGIPSVLAVLRTPGLEPALVFAAATELDARVAVQKCLEEMQLMRGFARWVRDREPKTPSEPGRVRTRQDHVNFYMDPANARFAAFLDAPSEARNLGDLPSLATGSAERDLAILLERIRAVGQRVLLADLTPPDLAPLGLSVVRAIVPGFQPLAFGHALRALALPRLWTVPQRLGYAGITPRNGDNPAPHPFP